MVCRNRRAGLTPYGGGVDVLRRGDAILAVAYCRQRLLCPAQIQRGSELVGHRDLYDLVFSDAVRKSAVVRNGPAQKRGGSSCRGSRLAIDDLLFVGAFQGKSDLSGLKDGCDARHGQEYNIRA